MNFTDERSGKIYLDKVTNINGLLGKELVLGKPRDAQLEVNLELVIIDETPRDKLGRRHNRARQSRNLYRDENKVVRNRGRPNKVDKKGAYLIATNKGVSQNGLLDEPLRLIPLEVLPSILAQHLRTEPLDAEQECRGPSGGHVFAILGFIGNLGE